MQHFHTGKPLGAALSYREARKTVGYWPQAARNYNVCQRQKKHGWAKTAKNIRNRSLWDSARRLLASPGPAPRARRFRAGSDNSLFPMCFGLGPPDVFPVYPCTCFISFPCMNRCQLYNKLD